VIPLYCRELAGAGESWCAASRWCSHRSKSYRKHDGACGHAFRSAWAHDATTHHRAGDDLGSLAASPGFADDVKCGRARGELIVHRDAFQTETHRGAIDIKIGSQAALVDDCRDYLKLGVANDVREILHEAASQLCVLKDRKRTRLLTDVMFVQADSHYKRPVLVSQSLLIRRSAQFRS